MSNDSASMAKTMKAARRKLRKKKRKQDKVAKAIRIKESKELYGYMQTLKRISFELLRKQTKYEIDLCLKLSSKGIYYQPQKVFLRKKEHGSYIVDFYIPSMKTVIEVDGGYHEQEFVQRKDAERDLWLNNRGIKVIRVKNHEVESFCVDFLTNRKEKKVKIVKKVKVIRISRSTLALGLNLPKTSLATRSTSKTQNPGEKAEQELGPVDPSFF